jgi:hypothetical protein
MIDDEYDYKAAYEAEIVQLWDALPEHVKTISLLQKVKQIATTECLQISSKLTVHGDQQKPA